MRNPDVELDTSTDLAVDTDLVALIPIYVLISFAVTVHLQGLLASVSGTVEKLQVHPVGGTVEAAKPIMAIVPQDNETVVEVDLLHRDPGFVQAGQSVSLKLEAFPFTRYGTNRRHAEQVSTDTTADERLGPIYPARIRRERNRLHVDGRRAVVSPGMQATADIRIGDLRLTEYLISSIARTANETGRER